ncbi:hypothetical protein AAZX31_17G193500 [Glycine max]|nr:hypothetical protein GLYMA_17G205566v4 [Glycine max]KAG4379225.1 hypothetical protein GLYMA_17G205566v4 [Glycine max]KAH1119328.1 hypothetical protein GYH30_047928 [Glycine max]KAH1119329.1 hypothetical protein GYH30_047928 [Glycine max]
MFQDITTLLLSVVAGIMFQDITTFCFTAFQSQRCGTLCLDQVLLMSCMHSY